MPKLIQFITYIFPSRYIVSILKGIFSKGVGLEILWWEGLLLTVYASTMIIWALKKFEKRIG